MPELITNYTRRRGALYFVLSSGCVQARVCIGCWSAQACALTNYSVHMCSLSMALEGRNLNDVSVIDGA
jgi:hypothetical protein